MTPDYVKDMLVRMAHHSTAIEGNPLTLGEVVSIVVNNYIPREMKEKDYIEVRNYRKILPILLDFEREKITPEVVREYNRIILTDIREDCGQYKKVGNIILGANFETAKPEEVPVLIEEWCNNCNFRLENAKTAKEKVEIILEQHIKFEKIHPFSDGNGRTGRLLIIDSCLRENLAPIIIPNSEKDRYIEFLAKEDVVNFTNLALELQEKESKRIKLFQQQE